MALTKAQKDTIESTLEFMIDPPQSKEEHDELQKKLFDTFAQKIDPAKDIDILWNCFANPPKYFRNLENLGPGITVGEVQSFIIECITKQLASTGFPLTFWDQEKILTNIHANSAAQEAYVTPKEKPENNFNPLQLPTAEGSLFTGEIGHDTGHITDNLTQEEETILWPYVLIKYHFPDQPETNSKIRLGEPVFQNQFGVEIDEMTYFDELLQEGYAMASTHATLKVIQYLIAHQIDIPMHHSNQSQAQNLVQDRVTPRMAINGPVSLLITHQFYFEKVLNRSIAYQQIYALDIDKAEIFLDETIMKCIDSQLPGLQFTDLTNYTTKELITLTNPAILGLIQHGLLRTEQAIQLSETAIKMISHSTYYGLIVANKLSIETILNITSQQVSLCMIPSITNLIQQQIYTIEQILKLPPQAKLAFTDTRFQELLKSNAIDPIKLIELDEIYYQLLAKPTIMKSIDNGQVDLKIFFDLPKEKIRDFMSSQCLYHLLDQGHLNIFDLINYNEAKKPEILIKGLSAAVHATANLARSPDKLDKNKIKDIANFIASCANECKFDQNQFGNMLAQHLVCTIQSTLANAIDKEVLKLCNPIFEKLLTLLAEKTNSDCPYWISAFDEAGQYATIILKKINTLTYGDTAPRDTSNISLFQKINTTDDDHFKIVKSTCNTLLAADKLISIFFNSHLILNAQST